MADGPFHDDFVLDVSGPGVPDGYLLTPSYTREPTANGETISRFESWNPAAQR